MSKTISTTQKQVLAILRRDRKPHSAYDVLAELKKTNPKAAPPTVYRALAALMDHGSVHRLESVNAYIACRCEHGARAAVMSICDDCGEVEESPAPELLKALSSITGRSGFAALRHVVEIHGRCANCAEEAAL